jgi:excisionase family DNA binding protein
MKTPFLVKPFLLTVRQASKLIGLSPRQVHKLISEGQLKSKRLIGRWYLHLKEVQFFLDSCEDKMLSKEARKKWQETKEHQNKLK